ncbi:MAG TPA: hypothetical protein VF602_09095 [Pedobacter sp.]|jgi:hypothetical protein
MKIQLIQGQFPPNEAIEVITRMIHIKIRYHESKISGLSSEEDIKSREAKIKGLQKDLFEVRDELLSKQGKVKMDAIINID